MDFTLVPVAKILEQIDNPLGCWQIDAPVYPEMALKAFSDGTWALADIPYSNGSASLLQSRLWHARRIAWLMKNGWEEPIQLDVGIPSLGYYPHILTDGHHRLCAAILTGEHWIKAQVSGAIDYAFELFGVDCSLQHETESVNV
jgi:hypothetical protein